MFGCVYQVRNPASRKCLDTLGGREGAEVGLYTCHNQAGNQVGVVMSRWAWHGTWCGGGGSDMCLVCRSLDSVTWGRYSLKKTCVWMWPPPN